MVFIFKFNCSSGKCGVILQDLPPELPLNFLGFLKKLPFMQACSMHKVPAVSTRDTILLTCNNSIATIHCTAFKVSLASVNQSQSTSSIVFFHEGLSSQVVDLLGQRSLFQWRN